MALFDTDVLIDHLRGNEEAQKVLLEFQEEANFCSVITCGEILFGMKTGEEESTFALLDCFLEIEVDSDIIRLAHDIKIRAKGYRLQLYDCVIAATAIRYNQVLVTGNVKHFPDKRLRLYVPVYTSQKGSTN